MTDSAILGWSVFGSFLVVIVVGSVVTSLVTFAVRRSSTTARHEGSRDDVLFVVATRRWQRVVLRTVGIAMLVVGVLMCLMALTSQSPHGGDGIGIAGVVMAPVGILFVAGARGMVRVRLEVTEDAVWAVHAVRKPRRVILSEVTRLTSIPASQFGGYGGVVAYAGPERLFSATRLMVGYRDLIDHIRRWRPDLTIPDDAQPL